MYMRMISCRFIWCLSCVRRCICWQSVGVLGVMKQCSLDSQILSYEAVFSSFTNIGLCDAWFELISMDL